MHVRPDRYISTGTFFFWFDSACGGRYRLKAISQLVVVALCVSFKSLPPNEAMLALVVTDIFVVFRCVLVSDDALNEIG